jgi:hypothetical protein
MRKLLPILILLSTKIIFAQQTPNTSQIEISGIVLEEGTNLPLEYATLVLQSVDNLNKVTGGITNASGKYSVKAQPGNYNIRIEYIGYKSYLLSNKQLTKSINLGTTKLSPDVSQLEEIELVGEKTTVEVRLDKKIYNIGKDLTNSGANISDALNNVPSVTVDVEGAISLRGNENVRILINGKPSAMSGFGSTDALSQLPADAIEKVEVITSPSARYDAEGTAGILNIVLKKEKTLGFNGSVNTTIGYPNSSQVSTNLNVRTDKFNVFSTLGYTFRQPPGNAIYDNTYTSSDYDRVIEDRDIQREDKAFNANLGMEYFITEKSSITGSIFGRLSDESDITETDSDFFIDSLLEKETYRIQDEKEDDESLQISLNYVNNFNDEGHKLTGDFQYSYDYEDVLTRISENNTFPTTEIIAQENIYEKDTENGYLFQVDYVLPMGDAQFEAGYRGNFEQSITDYQLDTININTGEFQTDLELKNKFTYDENINAVYTQYGNKFGDISFLLGLRLENTQLKGAVDSEIDEETLEETFGEGIDLNFDKNYLGLFPTINFIYELDEMENISIGYNRRINRPRGRYINPFPSRTSTTNIFQGNPDLNPAYANAFDIGYLKRWKKITFTSSIYYQKETNSFERIQEETGEQTNDGIDIIRTIPINLSSNQRVGAEAGALYSPAKWLRLNASVNIYQFKTEGIFNDVDYGTENVSWFSRLSSKVSLPAKVEWQTNAFYRGPSQTSQTKSEGMFFLTLAFSKDVFKENGTLSFNVRDVFNSAKRRSYTVADTFTSDSELQYRERQITLGFMYRFNQPKGKSKEKQQGNGDDEGDDF